MSRLRLCSRLLAGISCWLFLSGCLSVDVETRAGRDLSGTRTYRITLEPMLSRVYRSGVSAKMFDLPGQDLEQQEGIGVISKQEAGGKDGSLELTWSYRSKRLDHFTNQRDTVIFSKRQDKWWINYSYYQHCLPGRDTSGIPASGGARFRSVLIMPGQIYYSNGDSVSGSRAVWRRSMDVPAREGLVMIAHSREINPLLLVLLPVLLGGMFYFLLKRRIR